MTQDEVLTRDTRETSHGPHSYMRRVRQGSVLTPTLTQRDVHARTHAHVQTQKNQATKVRRMTWLSAQAQAKARAKECQLQAKARATRCLE